MQAGAALLTLAIALFCVTQTRDREPSALPGKFSTEPVSIERRADGANTVRARCGNRISHRPQTPTSAAEPSEEAMSWLPPPPSDNIPSYFATLDIPVPLDVIAWKMLTPPVVTLDYNPAPGTDFLVQNRPWLGTPTPEPGTFVLLLAAAMACLVYRGIRISRHVTV